MVAFVTDVPVDAGRITRAEFQRALVQKAAEEGRDSAPRPGGTGYGKLKEGAVADLLGGIWIQGEAEAMGIAVTQRRISRELSLIKKRSFADEAAYYEYLRDARLTQHDVRYRVELGLLSAAIERRVLRGVKGFHNELEALSEFVDEYSARWRGRTVCAPEFTIDRCSNGPPASDRLRRSQS